MGSRHRRYAALILGALGACSVGPPPGFSGGDRWTFPLVDPLDDGLLVTPVTVDGTGPYLFAIDPDASVSAVDTEVVAIAQTRVGRGPRRVDEAGAQQDRSYTELVNLQIGNLSIARRPAMVIPVGLYDIPGRHLHGVIGRDVLDDALVFGFNRDQGIAMLSTVKAFRPPPRAIDLTYRAVSSQLPDLEVRPVPRRLVRASVNGELYSLHLDLGAAVSQLRASHWASAGLVPAAVDLALVDEAGTVRTVAHAGAAKTVVVGPATRDHTVFLPFDDQRWETEGVSGTLGLDYFAPFSVWMHPETTTWYLAARGDARATATARLPRWGSAFPRCPHPGCVTVTAAPVASTDLASVAITVVRDAAAAGHALEVVLAPTPVPGKPTPGWIIANLGAGADQVTQPIGAAYAGATFQVVDVSPFPHACPDEAAGCIVRFGSPTEAPADVAAPLPAPAGPPPAPNVASDRLHRLTGSTTIAPSDGTRQAIAEAGTPPAIAVVKICLTAEGALDTVKLVKTSKVPAYDEQLLAEIKATWTFKPVVIGGSPARACASFTFRAR